MERFKQFLSSESWHDVIQLDCSNLAFNAFANILLYYFEISFLSFPLRRVNSNTQNTKRYKLSPELQSLKEKVILYSLNLIGVIRTLVLIIIVNIEKR